MPLLYLGVLISVAGGPQEWLCSGLHNELLTKLRIMTEEGHELSGAFLHSTGGVLTFDRGTVFYASKCDQGLIRELRSLTEENGASITHISYHLLGWIVFYNNWSGVKYSPILAKHLNPESSWFNYATKIQIAIDKVNEVYSKGAVPNWFEFTKEGGFVLFYDKGSKFEFNYLSGSLEQFLKKASKDGHLFQAASFGPDYAWIVLTWNNRVQYGRWSGIPSILATKVKSRLTQNERVLSVSIGSETAWFLRYLTK